MDTKLKNNKKKGLIIAGVIVALFTGCFMSVYPLFEKEAQKLQTDELMSEEFLQTLYGSNYVLYKDVKEKVKQTNYSYAGLYVEKEILQTVDAGVKNTGNYISEDLDTFVNRTEESMEHVMLGWETQMDAGIAKDMDYCVVDKATGEYIKNTGKNIEALVQNSETAKQMQELYEYYVIVNYDEAGHLGEVAVKHTQPDVLLKSTQQVMMGKNVEELFRRSSSLHGVSQVYYGYSSMADGEKGVELRVGGPKNVTFIYAMTQEQKEQMLHGNGTHTSTWNEWMAYYRAGTGDIYRWFLVGLTLCMIMFIKWKKLDFSHCKWVRLPIEAGVTLGIVVAVTFAELAVGLVSDTNRGYFPLKYEQYAAFIPTQLYPVMTGLINFVSIFLMFTCWCYLVAGWSEIGTLGIGAYLWERSIILKICKKPVNKWRNSYRSFKEELMHADLGSNVTKTLVKVVVVNFVLLVLICSTWVFGWILLLIYSVLLYYLLKRYIHKIQEQYQRMLEATQAIAGGNLNTNFDGDLGIFESYKDNLNQIQQGFSKAVEEEVKSQRMKTELITNVSHDLKTPLTAITTYIDLLKTENITEEQRREYIGVLEKKSLRLKTLIEDLFEVSKANSRNVTVQLVDVDICNLLRQVYLEQEERIEEAKLIFRFRMPGEKIILKLDSQKTYRIFENLYTNIVKYAMTGSRVYVDMERQENGVRIELKNMSATELQVDAEELTERFVRGDSSRNTEGSGLGLAIAKSFVEVQGGKMEICVDGDLFKVMIWFGEEM